MFHRDFPAAGKRTRDAASATDRAVREPPAAEIIINGMALWAVLSAIGVGLLRSVL